MNLNRLLHTTAIRVALRYAVYYALLTGLGLGVLYWATSNYVNAQIAAGIESELAALVAIDRQEGRARLVEVLDNKPSTYTENRRHFLLLASDGSKKAGDLFAWPPRLPLDGQVRNLWLDDDLIPEHIEDEDGFWPVAATILADGSRLLVAQGVHQEEDLQAFVLTAMAAILAVSIGLTLILGWRMGRQMLQRVDQINETARMIKQGDLTRRVKLTGRNDEFDELAEHLNDMLLHIERLINEMREVTDNVAHDLRGPLSRLRNRLEVTLLDSREDVDYRETMKNAMADIDGMIRTFNALLEIAQTEAGSYRGEWKVVDLSALARDVGDLYQGMADEDGQAFELAIAPAVNVLGNRHLLAQAISNLLENARQYAGERAQVALRLTHGDNQPQLTVSDSGPGIPAGDRHRVLKRFVRLDSARSAFGNGLGLSLVAAVATLHRAKFELADNHPGLRATITFAGHAPSHDENGD